MLENLKCPKKGLVGPWAHKYPNMGKPGPPIGFLQESLRWWDKWLKGKETDIMEEPMLRCYLNDTLPPQRSYAQRPGHWVAESSWPSERVVTKTMSLASGQLLDGSWANIEKISFSSPQTVGFAAGRWCPYGSATDLPGDQRDEAVGSQVFDSQPLAQPLDILGPIIVQLRIASDKPTAFVAAVVSEVLPDGAATRLSYGVLNLTHREGHVDLKPLEPGTFYDVTVRLNECGQRAGAGSAIRLALSTSYFPTVWPSPEAPTLTVDCASSQLKLPVRPPSPLDDELRPFEPAVGGPPLETKCLRPAGMRNTLVRDLATDRVTITFDSDEGLVEDSNNGWRWGGTTTTVCGVRPDDPLSARAEQNFRQEFGRGDLALAIDGRTSMTATESDWCITTRMEAWENEERIFRREHVYKIPRDHM